MALILKKTGAPSPKQDAPENTTSASQPKKESAPSKPTSMAFLKKGAEAQKAMAKEDAKAEERKKASSEGSVFRFWMPEGKDTSITFLDGDVDNDLLDITFLYEHNVFRNGHWRNWYICTQDTEPCPICEGGIKPYYAGFLTVIDHGEYTDKKGVIHRDEVKILVAKRDSLRQLLKLAVKRGGLRGCRFDVSRTGDKSPSIGNVFDFSEKLTDAQLFNAYGDRSKPLDIDTILTESYMDAAALRNVGFGSLNAPIGSEGVAGENYDDKL